MIYSFNNHNIKVNQQTTSSGLVYNSFTFNSDKKERYHNLVCTNCNTKNLIPLTPLKEKIEVEKKSRIASNLSREMIDRPVVTTFRCGNCNQVITTNVAEKDLEIYTNSEYDKTLDSYVDTLKNKLL